MRRLAAVLLLLGMVATLLVAVRHHHLDHAQDCQSASCVFCSGALATTPAPPQLVSPPALVEREVVAVSEAPAACFGLRLDHSGCAPPRG